MVKSKNSKTLIKRPAVVSVVGHVDHGKTTLLDYIRKSHITTGESGGITQHIGAYQVEVSPKNSKHKEIITFIDTPGHAAFAKLRCRGVNATDLAILVIDSVEGVKPQTVESLNHIKQANIPFIVALNKTDLPDASVDKVKGQLAEKEVLVEGYGGDVVCVQVSGKTGAGVDELLEMIILVSQMHDLKADINAEPEAVVIESKMDSRRGPQATILVKNGTFKIGDYLLAAETGGRIKGMFDESGKKVLLAGPSKPVEILGFDKVPSVGSCISATKILSKKKPQVAKKQIEQVASEEHDDEKRLHIILKADVLGSLEAIKDSLPEQAFIVSEGLGPISESDILLASSTKSVILAFRVPVSSNVQKLAEYESATIKSYDIIYKLLEDSEKKALRILEPTIDEEVLGKAKVIAQFTIKGNHIAGCKVKEGTISKKYLVHVKRADKLIGTRKIKFLQKERQIVDLGKTGDEIGIVFDRDIEFELGDDIISYKLNKLI